MPRTDENGRVLQAVLSYELNRAVPATEIFGALGMARNTYYTRVEEEDFPNAEEVRRICEAFSLNQLDLQIRFGLMAPEQVREYVDSPLACKPPTTRTQAAKKLSQLPRRHDVPPA